MTPLLLRTALRVAKCLPRGGFPLVRSLARRRPELQRWPVALGQVPGIFLEADLRESVWFPLWKYGYYPNQTAEDGLAAALLRPGERVWDIGANIGYTVAVYRNIVGPTGEVVAFEPSPRAAAYLFRSVSRWPNVAPFQLALSDREGALDFIENDSLNLSQVAASAQEARTIQVAATTLDAFLAQHGFAAPHFVKIDVEGHEPAVLRGGLGLLREHRPTIQFEARSNDELRSTLAVLRAAGVDYFIAPIWPSGELRPIEECSDRALRETRNFLALPAEGRERLTKAPFATSERETRKHESTKTREILGTYRGEC